MRNKLAQFPFGCQLIVLLLVAAAFAITRFKDGSNVHVRVYELEVEPRHILEYNPEYGHAPAWLSKDEIFLPVGIIHNTRGGHIYDLRSSQLRTLEPDLALDCDRGKFHDWSRVSDGRLSFLYECRDEDRFFIGRYLVIWDSQTEQYEILIKYAIDSFDGGAEEYAFATELDEVMQEANGGGIMHRLYRVSLEEGAITELFPDFYRAGSPSWSPDGEQFVFAGNDSGPELLKNIFAGYQNLHNEIYKPWNLYVADGEGENLQKILSGVRFVDTVKWSPRDKELIAFRGDYEQKLGLWLFNLEAETLTFLWPEGPTQKLRFDWSPDGSQMILLECREDETGEVFGLCQPVIITIPFE